MGGVGLSYLKTPKQNGSIRPFPRKPTGVIGAINSMLVAIEKSA